MAHQTRSKGALPSLPSENRKGKRKMTNDKISGIEKKKCLICAAKLLLFVDLTMETNIDKLPGTNQATIQDNPPPTDPTPTYPTSQNQTSSIQMPPKNTHFPNYPYPSQYHAYATRLPYLTPRLPNPTLQAPQYQTLLHQEPWYCAPLIPYQILSYQMPPYQKPTYPVHNVKTLTQNHIRKNLFNVEKMPIKIYTPLTEPIDQFYEKLRIVGHIAPISEIRINTRARCIEPSKVYAYHSGMKRYTIVECRDLKDKIQQLIDTTIIWLEDFAPTESQQ
ncbi:hypothetical protein KY285_010061 [Solanum tuberosum]|nr:hypothetical protein KY285_010061 [Solanum tuberosum]